MFRSIKSKILAVVAVTLLTSTVAVLFLFQGMAGRNVQVTTEQAIRNSTEAFGNMRQSSINMMTASIQALAGDDRIGAALAAGDRPGLLALCQPLYQSFHEKYGVTHWNFWLPEKPGEGSVKGLVNFLRVATPTRYGEFLERVTLARAVQTKDYVEGLDLGNTGYALRVIHPVYHDRKLCGYFEIGTDIASFLESMKRQSGNEYGLLLQKDKLDAKKWESSRTSRNQRDNWNDMPDLVLAQNTTQSDDIFAYHGSLETVSDQGQSLGLLQKNGQVYTRGAFALHDASGARVGAVFVLRDITAMYRETKAAEEKAVAVLLGLMLLSGAGMVLLFDRLIVVRLSRLIRVATRVVGGDFETRVEVTSRDEIGRFESLFEQFRALFVGVVKELDQNQRRAA